MSDSSRLQDLVALAHETSSVRRRELLRRVTETFLAYDPPVESLEMARFDEVLSILTEQMEQEVRAELAYRLAAAEAAPASLARRLARDEIAVAAPILANPKLLSEDDLLDVVRTRGQDHLRAISGRDGLSEAISDVIVERGDDQTLGVLIRNETASFSRWASETVVDRAILNPDLHEAVVSRRALPVDLLNQMYFVVEQRLRERILARNAAVDPAVLEAALSAGRVRVAAQDGALPADFAEAEIEVARALRVKRLDAASLAAYLRSAKRTQFMIGLSRLSEVEYPILSRIVGNNDLDALAIVCKAADLDRAGFMTFAVLIGGDRRDTSRAQSYGQVYAELPRETALRTLRFWRIRREGEVAAA
ncbi:MAG: DUF2336 domain-containing protein [Caulobacteraceae bacterium]